jgi:hypothetical protein
LSAVTIFSALNPAGQAKGIHLVYVEYAKYGPTLKTGPELSCGQVSPPGGQKINNHLTILYRQVFAVI